MVKLRSARSARRYAVKMDCYRIYINGIGVVSPFGDGIDAFWRPLLAGRQAMTICDPFNLGEEFRGPFGTLPGFGRTAVSAARAAIDEALLDAELRIGDLPNFGLYVASAHGESSILSGIVDRLVANARSETGPPGLIDDFLVEMLDDHMGRRALFTRNVKAACASTNVALAWASGDLAASRVETAIIVSVDTLSRAGTAGFRALGALAKEKIQPFSRKRDGTVIGEGAAAILLTKSRRPNAIELRSVGLSGDLDRHPVQSNAEGPGIELALRRTLALAEALPTDIDAVVYHATGTNQNDSAEAQACLRVFGERLPLGYALKPTIGHTMGAAAGMSLVAAAMMIKTGQIPPTLNVEPAELEFDLPFIRDEAAEIPVRSVLVNGFGFGGINSAALLSR